MEVNTEEGRGRLVIVGGHEDKRGPRHILKAFVELAGGCRARIAVVTTAASDEEAALDVYRDIFEELGAETVIPVLVQERSQASDPRVVDAVRGASGFFFTGGDQLRITSALGGSAVHRAIREAHRKGAVVGGTSAGASMMTATMIVEGRGEDAPRRSDVRMSPGMGFLAHAVVDQHFAQRGRVNRLFAAVAQNPEILGIGIDEDTAIVVETERHAFRVIGSQTVTVVDGGPMTHTTASESEADAPIAITDLRVHVLRRGYGFRLDSREPVAGGRRSPDLPGAGAPGSGMHRPEGGAGEYPGVR